jgi:predicted enzyme involved in methoxymalonyl-ACP biosynthesis
LLGCDSLHGVYLPTAKNEMVRDFYSRMGFSLVRETPESREFTLDLKSFQPLKTHIKPAHPDYEPS